jgi:hypothetical protein
MKLTEAQAAEAVAAFNQLYGEMEKALWCISLNCRRPLVEESPNQIVEGLVWTIKSWWGVQGVRKEIRTQMARALGTMEWSDELFRERAGDQDQPIEFACELVDQLVLRTMRHGGIRREYSLASKVLHWLLPWRVPIYDSFVRKSLGIPANLDHPQAYRLIVQKQFAMTQRLSMWGDAWRGAVPPLSDLRAIDKCLWWIGGGNSEGAVLARNPWSVVFKLDVDCGDIGPWWMLHDDVEPGSEF